MERWQLPSWMDPNMHRAKVFGSTRVRMEACGYDRNLALDFDAGDARQRQQAAKSALTQTGLLMEAQPSAHRS